jgi:hypothetical protein
LLLVGLSMYVLLAACFCSFGGVMGGSFCGGSGEGRKDLVFWQALVLLREARRLLHMLGVRVQS